MQDSHIELPPEIAARLIQGHDANGQPVGPWHVTALAGAGAITSTAADLANFMQAQFDESSPLAGSLAWMRERQPTGMTAIGSMIPQVQDRFVGSSAIRWHDGQVNGYCAYLSVDPTHKTAVAVLINQQKDASFPGFLLTWLVRTQSW